jgi:hypothetical protein
MVQGIKRIMGERDRAPKLPITIPILQRILTLHPNPSSIAEFNYIAAVCLAVAALLRSGEFTHKNINTFDATIHLTRGSVCFEPSFEAPTHITLHLPSSKTDPFRRGVTLYIAAAPHALTCPISRLKTLYISDPRPSDSPLFVGQEGNPLLRKDLIQSMRNDLAKLGFDPRAYSGHSFRRGGATSAFAARLTDFEIQQLGRWRSDTYMLYIEPDRRRMLQVSSCIHWAVPVAQDFVPPVLPFAI